MKSEIFEEYAKLARERGLDGLVKTARKKDKEEISTIDRNQNEKKYDW